MDSYQFFPGVFLGGEGVNGVSGGEGEGFMAAMPDLGNKWSEFA